MVTSLGKFSAALTLAALLNGAALAQLVVPLGATISVPPGGSLNLGCGALDVQGTLNVNSGQISNTGNASIGNTGTVNGGSGTISVSGNWSNSGSFAAGTGTVVMTDGCAAGQIQLAGTTVFNNLILSSTNGITFIIPAGAGITVNGTLTLQGTAGQPIQLISSSGQSAVISLGPQAQVIRNFATVPGTVQIGAASTPQGIPTLSEYSIMALALLLATTAFWRGGPVRAGFKRKQKQL
jgi:hypothetical protein